MTRDYNPRKDPNYRVDGVPPCILGKITQLLQAHHDYAFIGAAMPEEHAEIEHNFGIASYNLERTILTELEKARSCPSN